VSNNHHRQQWTSADGASQVRDTPALAARTATWLRDEEATLTMHTRTGAPARAAGVALPNLAVLDQDGACGAAGLASAAGSALEGPPAARQASTQSGQINTADTSRRPRQHGRLPRLRLSRPLTPAVPMPPTTSPGDRLRRRYGRWRRLW
jgi:hypothetical protein